MKKIIIITGISGTGKSSLSKKLYNEIENSTLLSYDELSENIYDIIGFKNIEDKKSLQLLNMELYKRLIEEAMKREDEVIILEKPFTSEWKEVFESLIKKYKYQACTINMYARDFDTIWNRLLKREKSQKDRHPSHYLNSYCLKNREKYDPYFEYHYDSLKEEYDKLISNSINLGTVINIKDIEDVDIEKLIQKILE